MTECEKGTRIGGEWSESSQPPTVAIIFFILGRVGSKFPCRFCLRLLSFLQETCDFSILFHTFLTSLRKVPLCDALLRALPSAGGISDSPALVSFVVTRWDKVGQGGTRWRNLEGSTLILHQLRIA